MEKLNDLRETKHRLIEETKRKVMNTPIEEIDAKELGAATDMIKDLAEAEEKCVKAAYYMTVIEAMNNDSRYGYNMNRDSRGRFTSGFTSEPMIHNMDSRAGYDHMPTATHMMDTEYHKWQNARRNYHETMSKSDKDEMDKHAKAHLNEAMTTLKEVMANSDPDLQRKMKNDLTNLINDLS